MIQFEYNELSIHARVFLKDYYDYLIPLGYKIGKLYPKYVLFKDYELKDDDFLGGNYIAIREDDEDLESMLAKVPSKKLRL